MQQQPGVTLTERAPGELLSQCAAVRLRGPIGAASPPVGPSKRCPLSSLSLRRFAIRRFLTTHLHKPPPAMDRLCPGEGVSRTQAPAGKL